MTTAGWREPGRGPHRTAPVNSPTGLDGPKARGAESRAVKRDRDTRARSSAWLERTPDKREVDGSNPSGPIRKTSPCKALHDPQGRLPRENR